MILHLLGIIGNLAFGFGCVPVAWKTAVAGRSVGTPVSLAWTLVIACLAFYTYMLGTYGLDPFIAVIAIVETLSWLIVLRYHYAPRHYPGCWWHEGRRCTCGAK